MLKKIALLFCFFSFTFTIAPAFADNDFNTTYQLAQKGDAREQYNLGVIYLHGEGVKQDDKQAFNWLQKAAKQGDPKAQYAVGSMYYEGKGVKQDDKLAFIWFYHSAEQGDAEAQYKIGEMFLLDGKLNDKGVEDNFANAVFYFLKSAENGNADAQYMLGIIRKEFGNLPEAKKDFNLACENGHQLGCDEYRRLNNE